jgi:hypothetical protein
MPRHAVICALVIIGLHGAAAAKVKRRPVTRPRVESLAPPVRAQPVVPATRAPAPAAPPRVATRAETARDVVREESKIEFDDRMVQGQTASGAIYLFQRGESEFNSMVHAPATFRERTLQKVYARPQEP